METIGVVAGLLTGLAGISTAIALIVRDRETLRHIERLSDLIPKLDDERSRGEMESLRNELAYEYALKRSAPFRGLYVSYRAAIGLWLSFIVLVPTGLFAPLPSGVKSTLTWLGSAALGACLVVLIWIGGWITVRWIQRRRAAR